VRVPLFKQKPILCPICQRPHPQDGDHLLSHVVQQGSGYTWHCACGLTELSWPRDIKAAAALGVHFFMRHKINMGGPRPLAAAIALSDNYDGHQ